MSRGRPRGARNSRTLSVPPVAFRVSRHHCLSTDFVSHMSVFLHSRKYYEVQITHRNCDESSVNEHSSAETVELR